MMGACAQYLVGELRSRMTHGVDKKKKKKLKSYCFPLVRNFYRLRWEKRDWSKGINSLRSGWTYVWQLCAFKVSDKRQKVHRSAGEAVAWGSSKVHPVKFAGSQRGPSPGQICSCCLGLSRLLWGLLQAGICGACWRQRDEPTRLQQVAVTEQMMQLIGQKEMVVTISQILSSKLEVRWVICLWYLAPSRTRALPLFLSPALPQEGALASASPVSNSWLRCLSSLFRKLRDY